MKSLATAIVREERKPSRKELLPALKFIFENLDKSSLSISEISIYAGLSVRTLEDRFKEWRGIPVFQFITELRMNETAKQLVQTKEQVGAIGLSVGNDDLSHLDNMFKKYFGCTPSEFRNFKK